MKFRREQVVLALMLMLSLMAYPAMAQYLTGWSDPVVLDDQYGYVDIELANINGDAYTDLMTIVYKGDFGPDPQSIPTYWTFNPDGPDPLTALTLSGVPRPDGSRAIAAFDMDGDGDDDMLVSNLFERVVGWYGNDGTDTPESHLIAGGVRAVHDIVAGDFDGDDDADVFFSSRSDDMLYYAEQDGDNWVVTEYPIPAGQEPEELEAGDFDGDGDMDVIIANRFLGGVLLAENAGDGTFTVNQIYVPGGSIGAIEATDIDMDGDYDFIVAMNDSSRTMLVVQSDLDVFNEYMLDDTFAETSDIRSGDMDMDGDMDIVLASGTGNAIAVLENMGNYTFMRADVANVTGAPMGFQLIDLDMDDDLDIVTTSPTQGVLAYYTTSENPFITKTVMEMVGTAREILAEDMDMDGDVDILVGTVEGQFLLLENQGMDGFVEHVLVDGRFIPDFLTMDWDDDGMMDIIGADMEQDALVFWRQTDTLVFEANTLANVPEVEFVELSDLDQDGLMDIAVGMGDGFRWYEQTDPYTVVEHIISDYVSVTTTMIVAGDWTLDGAPDLMTSRANGPNRYLTLFVNTGDGSSFNPYPVDDHLMIRAFFHDYNGDNVVDLSTGYEDELNYYRNNNPGFTIFTLAPNNSMYYDHTSTDVDLDGDYDIVSVLMDPMGFYFLANDGFGAFSADYMTEDTGSANRIFAADMDADGDDDFVLGQDNVDGDILWVENQLADFATGPRTAGSNAIARTVAASGAKADFTMMASPNPFNAATTLNMTLPTEGKLTVQVFDITGRLVTTLADGTYNAGSHRLVWNAEHHASGVYFVRATALGQAPQVRKVMLVR